MIGDTLNAAIGQGFVLTSPLQLAVMTARIATGRAVTPRLMKSVDGVEAAVPDGAPRWTSNRAHLRLVRRGMYARHQRPPRHRLRQPHRRGQHDAWPARPAPARSATSPPPNAPRGVIRNEDLPWDRRDHALFVGLRARTTRRASRCRSWSSMAAAGRSPPPRSRATSCCRRFTAARRRSTPIRPASAARIRTQQEQLILRDPCHAVATGGSAHELS